MNKPKFLARCQKECCRYLQKGCCYADIEGFRGEDVPLTACSSFSVSELTTNQPNQRLPEKTKKSEDEAQAGALSGRDSLKLQEKTTFPDKRSPPNDIDSMATDSKKTLSLSEPFGEHSRKNSSFSRGPLTPSPLKLTKTEKEYVRLISQGITNIVRIAKIRKCTKRMAQKHIKHLKQKGVINNLNEIVCNLEGYSEHLEKINTVLPGESTPKHPHAEGGADTRKQIRLHGQQLRIEILEKDEKYKNKINTSMCVFGNLVLCQRDVIEIYSETSFIDYDIDIAMKQSLQYFRRVTAIIQNDLKITLLRERAQNIKLVKAGQYAEVGNELAEKCVDIGEKIRVIDEKDGLWFLIDASFNEAEAETVHSQTAKGDMQEVIQPFFNDLRTQKITLSDTLSAINKLTAKVDMLADQNIETARGFTAFIKFMGSQFPKESDEKHESNAPKEKSKHEPRTDVMYG